IKILSGVYKHDSGNIRINDEDIDIDSSADAKRAGISVVHQHSALIGRLTVAENIRLAGGRLRLPQKQDIVDFEQTAEDLGFQIDPDRITEDYSIGDQQRIEIIREIAMDAQILILDEPTATLAPSERESLFATLRSVANLGKAVVLVTHRLEEALEYCDEL